MSSPPATGPMTGASTTAIPTVLITRPIRLGPAARASMICPAGTSMPPATPCSTRNAMSSSIEAAAAHSTEASVKAASEASQIPRAEKRRLSQPTGGIAAASASR